MTRIAAVLSIFLLLLASCGESGLLLPPLSEDGDIAVQTVADGAVLGQSDSVSITLEVGPQGSAPDRVVVSLVDGGGRVVRTVSHTAAEIDRGRVPSLAVAGIEPGLYVVEIEFFGAGSRLGGHERTIFVVNASHRVAGISVYPPFLEPDSLGILRADLDIPAESDPWLRWSFAGRPVSEGRLSDGAGQIVLRSPRTEGVYAVRLELFPQAPRAGDFRFSSTIVQNSDLVVREARPGVARGFGPASSFYALLHLAGNLRDAGMRTQLLGEVATPARLIGEPDPRIVQDYFGYFFENGGGIEFNEVLLPFRDGGLEPFSVVVRLLPARVVDGAVLFSAASADGAFALTVRQLEEGFLAADLRRGERSARVVTDVPVAPAGVPLDFNLAVLPGPERTELRWFARGERVGGDMVPIGFPAPSDGAVHAAVAGVTRIGGPGGFVGLLGEFGVFFRDANGHPAADIERFRAAGARRFGDDLILAEGFESGLGAVLNAQDAEVNNEAGVLRLAPGGTVVLRPVDLADGSVVVEVTPVGEEGDGMSTVEAMELRLGHAAEGADILLVRLNGAVEAAGLSPARLSFSNPFRLTLSIREGAVVVSDDAGGTVSVPLVADPGAIDLTVINRSVDRTVEIESILVYRDRERMSGIPDAP